MKQDNSKKSVPILALLGFVLVVIGSQSAWMSLPLSGSSPELVVGLTSYAGLVDSFRRMLLVTALIAIVCSVFRYRQFSIQIAFVSMLIIVGFVYYGLFNDPQLVLSYMNQSEGREALRSFIAEYYWRNNNPDHTVSLITEYEYLSQRMFINWNIIGVGLKIAFLGSLLLFIGNVVNKRLALSATIITLVFIVGIAIVFVPLLRADNIHRQADVLLESGQQRLALESYEKALELDPMLLHSSPFLRKVSRAYFSLEGENSFLADLYQLHTALSGINMRVTDEALVMKIDQVHPIDNTKGLMKDKTTALQEAVISESNKVDSVSWVIQGKLEYELGALIESLRSFREALTKDESKVYIKFFIAHILLELQKQNDALATLQSLLPSVWNNQLRADLLCTIGDVYQKSSEPLLARKAFTACYELDPVYNYRAVKMLSGT